MFAAYLRVGENYNLGIVPIWKLHAYWGVNDIKNSWSHENRRLCCGDLGFIQRQEALLAWELYPPASTWKTAVLPGRRAAPPGGCQEQ